ncbi:MAG: hypothetical protein RI973_56 [Bacteroidota bacterium]
MLVFFRTNQVYYSILLIFYILLLRFSVFIAPFEWEPSGKGWLSEMIYGAIGSQQLLSHIAAMLLLLTQGFMVNLLVLESRLSNESNQFPGLFFVFTACIIPDFLYLSPVLIGNFFFLMALAQMLSTYKNPACSDRIFNAGLLTGIASFCYFPYIFFALVLLASLAILRTLNPREILVIFTGLLLPYFLVGIYYFWFDRLDYFLEVQFGRNLGFFNYGNHLNDWDDYLKVAVFIAFIVFVLVNNGTYLYKKNIQAQKKISIFYWVLIAAGLAVPFQVNATFEHLLMLTPALGILVSFTFTRMKPQWAESVHFLLLLLVLSLQFVPWLL